MAEDIEQENPELAEAADTNVEPPAKLEPEAPPQPPLHEELGLGDDFKDLPPDETARRLHNDLRYERKLREQYEQTANQAAYQWRNNPEYQQFDSWRREQAKPKADEQPKFWDPPQFNKPLVEQWTEVDPESKAVRFKAGTPPHVLDMVAKYHDYLTDFHENKWKHNPFEALKPWHEHTTKALVNQMLEERLGERDERRTIDDFERANARWLYEFDQAGQPVVNPMTGKFEFSPGGKLFMRYVAEAAEMGIVSQSRRASYALRMLERDRALANHQTKQTTEDAEVDDEQKKLDFQKSAARRTAGRGGSFPKPETRDASPQNKKKKTIAEKLREALEAEGVPA